MIGIDLTAAAVELRELSEWWGQLEQDRERGTRRRWTEQQQETDWLNHRVPVPAADTCPECGARMLRRTWLPPSATQPLLDGRPWCPNGHQPPVTWKASAAPGQLDVLEVLAELGTAVLELEENVREHLWEPYDIRNAHLGVAEPLFRRPARLDEVIAGGTVRAKGTRRRRIRARHGRQPAVEDVLVLSPTPGDRRVPDSLAWLSVHVHRIQDPWLREHIAQEAGRMARAARRTLGTAERTQRLQQPCPVCGSLSLIAFLERCPSNGWRRCKDLRCTAVHGMVVCTVNVKDEEPLCVCQLEVCPDGCHYGGRHRWEPEDYRRLGLVLEAG